MEQLLVYIGEGGVGAGMLFISWKWGVPLVKNLYKELVSLREENAELKIKNSALEMDLKHTSEQLEYFKGKYMKKVVLKSHGKKIDTN